MSTNLPKNVEDQEIDLSLILKKVGNLFQKINALIFNCIQFVFKNTIVIAILFLVGFGIGLYLDNKLKTYNQQIIIAPNFGSADYLYSKIELIEAKIEEDDTIFLKKVGISDSKEILEIEINPIIDIYRFVNGNPQNFELIKLMAEDTDLTKIITDEITSKNYPVHLISLKTKNKVTTENNLKPLLDYLNDNEYFKKSQEINLDNCKIKMKANEGLIAQIDTLLYQYSQSGNKKGLKSANLVYYNENTQVNELLKTKDGLIQEQAGLRINLLNMDKIIKDISITSNIKNTKSLSGKLKFILPLFFMALLLIGYFFRSFYRKQSLLANKN